MKFKIGDKVRIKKGFFEIKPKIHPGGWDNMPRFDGERGEIKGISKEGLLEVIALDDNWWYAPEWLEPVKRYKVIL